MHENSFVTFFDILTGKEFSIKQNRKYIHCLGATEDYGVV